MQVCDDIVKSPMNEPGLIVFWDDHELQIKQQFITAEQEMMYEIPSTKLIDGLALLMAVYYVFDVSYNPACKATYFDGVQR